MIAPRYLQARHSVAITSPLAPNLVAIAARLSKTTRQERGHTVTETPTLLDYTIAPLGALGLNTTRIGGAIVGRRQQFDAAEQQLAAANTGIAGIVVEGEPG